MIVVNTPTGTIGRQMLQNILAGHEPIRVIARDPSRLPASTRERVEVVQGSHGDADVVNRTFAGRRRPQAAGLRYTRPHHGRRRLSARLLLERAGQRAVPRLRGSVPQRHGGYSCRRSSSDRAKRRTRPPCRWPSTSPRGFSSSAARPCLAARSSSSGLGHSAGSNAMASMMTSSRPLTHSKCSAWTG